MRLGLGDRKDKLKKKLGRKISYSEVSDYLYNNPDIYIKKGVLNIVQSNYLYIK